MIETCAVCTIIKIYKCTDLAIDVCSGCYQVYQRNHIEHPEDHLE